VNGKPIRDSLAAPSAPRHPQRAGVFSLAHLRTTGTKREGKGMNGKRIISGIAFYQPRIGQGNDGQGNIFKAGFLHSSDNQGRMVAVVGLRQLRLSRLPWCLLRAIKKSGDIISRK
jgi:hypothetical protein